MKKIFAKLQKKPLDKLKEEGLGGCHCKPEEIIYFKLKSVIDDLGFNKFIFFAMGQLGYFHNELVYENRLESSELKKI